MVGKGRKKRKTDEKGRKKTKRDETISGGWLCKESISFTKATKKLASKLTILHIKETIKFVLQLGGGGRGSKKSEGAPQARRIEIKHEW